MKLRAAILAFTLVGCDARLDVSSTPDDGACRDSVSSNIINHVCPNTRHSIRLEMTKDGTPLLFCRCRRDEDGGAR